MTHGELIRRMTAREFIEWQLYFAQPEGPRQPLNFLDFDAFETYERTRPK